MRIIRYRNIMSTRSIELLSEENLVMLRLEYVHFVRIYRYVRVKELWDRILGSGIKNQQGLE